MIILNSRTLIIIDSDLECIPPLKALLPNAVRIPNYSKKLKNLSETLEIAKMNKGLKSKVLLKSAVSTTTTESGKFKQLRKY